VQRAWRQPGRLLREDRPASARQRRDDELSGQIGQVHDESKGTYGWPRIHAELRHRGVRVSRKRVARLMRRAGLSGMVRRRKGKTTIRVPGIATAPDLVRRDFAPEAPNRLWVADLTEVATWEGKLYLAVVIDAFSRRCVGWAMAEHMRAELVVEALEMAIWQRRPDAGLVHHSDRGGQPGLNRSSQRCVGELNLGTAGDGFTGFAAGTRLGWRGCRRGGSPGGRAGAA
jgi:putative transposase